MRLNLPASIAIIACFNPRICKRCDLTVMGPDGQWVVSIHASVKDATTGRNADKLRILVSIHASVKDATRAFHFPCIDICVSIHASVKDATM